MCVGELLLGVEPRNSRLVENLRDNPLLFCSGSLDESMGDVPSSGWSGL